MRRPIGINPATGAMQYSYDSVNDPDYIADSQAGYQAPVASANTQQMTTPQAGQLTPTPETQNIGRVVTPEPQRESTLQTILKNLKAYEIPEGMTLPKWGQIAKEEVGSMVKGVKLLPTVVPYLATHPQYIPSTAVEIGKGTLKDWTNLLTRPLYSFYNRPIGSALDVATAAMVAKGFKAIDKSVEEANRVSANLLVSAANNPEMFQATKETTKSPTYIAKVIAEQMGKGVPDEQLDMAAKMYGSGFTVPTRRAWQLNPNRVYKTMIADNITGSTNQLKAKTDAATRIVSAINREAVGGIGGPGIDPAPAQEIVQAIGNRFAGIVPENVTRKIALNIGKVLGPKEAVALGIEPKEIMDVADDFAKEGGRLAGLSDVATDVPEEVIRGKELIAKLSQQADDLAKQLANVTNEDDAVAISNKIKELDSLRLDTVIKNSEAIEAAKAARASQVVSAAPGGVTTAKIPGGQTPLMPMTPEGGMFMDPTDAMESQRWLEKMAAFFRDKNMYTRAPNPQWDVMAQMYQSAANELGDAIQAASKNASVIDKFKTPQVYEALSKLVSPEFADRYFKTVHSVADSRSAIRDYVRLSEIIRQTETAASTQASHVASSLMARLGAGVLGGGIYGPGGFLAGLVGSPLAAPAVEQGLKRIPQYATKAALQLEKVGPALGKAGRVAQVAGTTGLVGAVERLLTKSQKYLPEEAKRDILKILKSKKSNIQEVQRQPTTATVPVQ